MAREKAPAELRPGDRVRVSSKWSPDLGGTLGWVEQVSSWDIVVRMDSVSINGTLISFPRAALELVHRAPK